MKKFSIKSGFTLAEVMVCLVVICIIASIAMPVVNAKKPPKNKIIFKRAYATATRIVYELVNDPELYPDKDGCAGLDNTDPANGFSGGTGKFSAAFKSKLNAAGVDVQSTHYPGGANGPVQPVLSTEAVSADGVMWDVPYTDFKSSATITVDVNGPDKGSNQKDSGASCTGEPDIFEIIVEANGKVSPAGPCAKKYLEDVNFNAK